MKRGAAFLLLLMVFCAACGLPIPQGTTAVRTISGPQPADETDLVKRIPAPPAPGATPEGIVQGFLAAGNDPVVAREYLTAANPWSPTDNTTVFTGYPVVKVTAGPGGTMNATATVMPILFINEDGSTQVPKTTPLPFKLTRENGEWRIAGLLQGSVLQQSDLASSFRRGALGWLSPDHGSLVRESVLLPDPESFIPNLVSALVAGPALPLAAAGVTSALPGRVTADPPLLEGAQLTVGLHTNGSTIATQDLKAIRAQFAATLLSSEITSIVLTVNGQPLVGGSAAITAADETNFDRDIPGSSGIAATAYLATASGIAPLVLPGPFAAGSTAGSSAVPSAGSSATPTRPASPGVFPATPTPATPTPSPADTPTATRSATPGAATPTATTSASTSASATGTPSASASARPGSTPGPSTPPVTTFSPGVPISAFAVSVEGQRFAELRESKAGMQPVEINLGSDVAVPLGPARDYTSLAWGADDTLWLTTATGDIYLAPRDRAPQQITQQTMPLKDLLIAPDGIHAVGISTTGALVAGLASDGAAGSTAGVTSLTTVAPSLENVTAVSVIGSGTASGSGGGGLTLLVAATLTTNQLVPGPVGAPVTGLWKVSTGAPDPSDLTAEALSETVAPLTSAPCAGKVSGLVARPGAVSLAECGDFSVEALDQRPGPLDGQWLPAGRGLVGYPLG